MSVPSVFGLPHLSEDSVAAFADGVLSDAAAGRARRHCAECLECADAVRVQRETAMVLRTASAPAMPAGLLDRLAGLPMSTPLPPPTGGLPTVMGADGVPMIVAFNPVREPETPSDPEPGTAHSRAHHRRNLPMTVLASAAAVVAAGALGGGVQSLAAQTEPVTPAVNYQPVVAPGQQSLLATSPILGTQGFATSVPAATFRPAVLRTVVAHPHITP